MARVSRDVSMAKYFSVGAFVAVLFALHTGPALALELLMVERAGCSWCDRWNAQIAPIYGKSEEGRRAPLYRADINRLPRVVFKTPVIYTPTFVLIDGGREVGRITGFANQNMFWGTLDNLLYDRTGTIR